MSNVKAIFPTGVTEVTVHGLHQWDYGRSLEITLPHRDPTQPLARSVHFARERDNEVVNAGGSFDDAGVATVRVPDVLLEHSGVITAWVYESGQGCGETIGTIILPVKARAKPPAEVFTEST